MSDRTKPSKSPWMRLFTLTKTKVYDDLEKSQIEAKQQIIDMYTNKRGTRRQVVK